MDAVNPTSDGPQIAPDAVDEQLPDSDSSSMVSDTPVCFRLRVYRKPRTTEEEQRVPKLEDALDPDPRREGYLRPELLEEFRAAYLFVEKRVVEYARDSLARSGLLMWEFSRTLGDAKAFIVSGGRDARRMFETEAWHLVLYLAQMLHPTRFTWYPGHQQVTVKGEQFHSIVRCLEPGFRVLDLACRTATPGAVGLAEQTLGWDENDEDVMSYSNWVDGIGI
ncbi:hypothetical protein TWF696_004249 [Orbilia brochopaga]|uniref:Uncharacterized protein n=1 Tax=Orbilia brochopaga TaxID=3140254 RepID=A0AAV9VC31_9PEZI